MERRERELGEKIDRLRERLAAARLDAAHRLERAERRAEDVRQRLGDLDEFASRDRNELLQDIALLRTQIDDIANFRLVCILHSYILQLLFYLPPRLPQSG